MSIFYNLIFLVLALIYLPLYLFKGKFHHGFLARMGILPSATGAQQKERPIWIHAVSVGEVMAVRGLVEGLRVIYPGQGFVISTVTPTGNKIAQTLAGPADRVTYLPLDFSSIVRGVINKLNPCVFIIAETEIWPNLITCLHKKNIPVITVNGRISDMSFKGYSAARFFIKPILNKVSLFCVQTKADCQRFLRLGVDAAKVRVTGNMKFDQVFPVQRDGYRKRLGLGSQEKFFVAGSTHPGEEEAVLTAYKCLLKSFPDLKLLIAPRHPNRANRLLKTVADFGLSGVEVSRYCPPGINGAADTVFVLDSVGELMNFYALADIVFIGGSLVKKGGHNILEPASLDKPVIFGPHMFNFRDIAQIFLKNDAALMVNDAKGLAAGVEWLLGDPQRSGRLVASARKIIMQNQGATQRNIREISVLMGAKNGD